MTAYENGLKSNDTRFLLKPDLDFFKFFGNPSGSRRRQRRPRLPPNLSAGSEEGTGFAFATALLYDRVVRGDALPPRANKPRVGTVGGAGVG